MKRTRTMYRLSKPSRPDKVEKMELILGLIRNQLQQQIIVLYVSAPQCLTDGI